MSKKKEKLEKKEILEKQEEQKNISDKETDLQDSGFEAKKNFSFVKKSLLILVFVFLILIFIIGFSFFKNNNSFEFEKIPICGDGSFYNTCSLDKPFYCENGTLVEKASLCGCLKNFTKKNDSCVSEYQTGPKNISLKYILRGEQGQINFTVYKGAADYFGLISEKSFYNPEEKFSKKDFQLKKINNFEQKELLLPLVVKIENLAETKEDQARIAISVAQNMVYNSSNGLMIFFDRNSSTLLKYPYQTLYDGQGVCEARSELLAFLLKEIGYGVVLFYYPEENHAAVGIKCPLKDSSYGSGYCFVETTGSSIITDNKEYYPGWGELSDVLEISLISDGISFPENAYEYKDAKKLIQINNILKKRNFLGRIYQIRLKNLIQKYGLNNYQL